MPSKVQRQTLHRCLQRRRKVAASGRVSRQQRLSCAKFKSVSGGEGGGGGVRRARSAGSPPPGPAHLQQRVGSDEVPGGLRQLHSPPVNQQRHRGDGSPAVPGSVGRRRRRLRCPREAPRRRGRRWEVESEETAQTQEGEEI